MAKRKVKPKVSRGPKELAKDLGLDPSMGLEWEVRHAVTSQIIQIAREKGISAADLAMRSQTSRARTTKILKGDTGGISLDVIFRVLESTGQKLKFRILEVG